MSLKKLREIKAARPPSVCAFEPAPGVADKWRAGIVSAQQGADGAISILDVIGEDGWTGGGVTSKSVVAALRAIGDREVFVNLNSPGGDFFEGIAIYNALRAHPRKVTVRILGLAASAASVVAMAGDEILIGKAAFLMVHNAWVVAIGNRNDLEEAARVMAPFDDAMAALYAERAGVAKATAAEWMDGERWFSGEQAVSEGLATGYLPADQVAEDQALAARAEAGNATRRIDHILARSGVPREERRSLIRQAKSPIADGADRQASEDTSALIAALTRARTALRG